MPVWVYKARTVGGESQTGEVNAASEADVVGQLRRRRLVVISVKEKPKDIKLSFAGRVKTKDLVLFTRDWGFTAAEVTVPVRWWHGDDDHIVPLAHGQHLVERLPDATLKVIAGESHLGGLGIAQEVLGTLMELGPRRSTARPAN